MAARSTHPLAAGKLPGDLLARLIETYRTPADDAVIVEASYGFDAAALTIGGETLIVKSDPITFATENAAHYLVAVNANDIACLGGIPRWMTVVALLPENRTTEASVEAMFADLQAACTSAGITVLGGHTEITLQLDRALLIGTMLGTAGPTGLLLPGKASAGDELYVTKAIGIEGTALLATERADILRPVLGTEALDVAARLIHEPGISVVRDARIALDTGCVTALHDPTEGGLATAVHEISEASGLGATVERSQVPIRQDTAAICESLKIDPLGLLSSGALLIAAKPGSQETLQAAFDGSSIAITRIGTLTAPEAGHTLVSDSDTWLLPRYDADELTRALS
ncbi:MAG TPA: AIR synthase-related protein [Thermomicrobiales bacterium]|nr:AIR synthase-related protein [Thermomicrobiales bacterium]